MELPNGQPKAAGRLDPVPQTKFAVQGVAVPCPLDVLTGANNSEIAKLSWPRNQGTAD